MREENEFFFGEEQTMDIVQKYEDMLRYNRSFFFDVSEFENIIDFYLDSDNSKRASEAIDIAYSMHPYSSEIQFRKAESLFYDNKHNEALNILNVLEKIEPENSEILFLKGKLHIEQHELKIAHSIFWRAAQGFNEDKLELLLRIASLYQDYNELNYALRYLLLAYKIEENNLNVLFELGYTFERLGEIQQSEKFYNLYLDINPFSSSVWYNMGIVYTRMGKFSKALDAYEYALAV
ncbi:MAG: tetratricopeptide repeat protein, partial [Perlabentimonas sp.]